MKQNLVGKILGKIKIFVQDFVTIVTGISSICFLPFSPPHVFPNTVLRFFIQQAVVILPFTNIYFGFLDTKKFIF